MQQLTAGALAFVLVGLVLPGLGLQAWARVAVDPALVLPLGAAGAALAFWLSLVTGWPWLFPALCALSAAGLLRRSTVAADAVPLRPIWAPALALVALLAVTQYSGNRPLADGGFLLDPMGDQPLHAGIAWELTLPYPPEVPGLAGIPLHYHYGADLVRAQTRKPSAASQSLCRCSAASNRSPLTLGPKSPTSSSSSPTISASPTWAAMGADHFKTPHIDSLALSGIRYTHAYITPLCGPSARCLLPAAMAFAPAR